VGFPLVELVAAWSKAHPSPLVADFLHRINARELWEQMNTCSCLNPILACIVYWRGREFPGSSASATRSPMESISPCWNTSAPSSGITSCSMASVSSPESSSASAVAQKESASAYKITRISLVPFQGKK
jgi:hypothetical protein